MSDPAPRRGPWGFGLFVLALAAGAAFAFLPKPTDRPGPSRTTLLDATVRVADAPALLAFRVARPGAVEITVDLPAGAATDVDVGLPGVAPPGLGGPYLPDPKTAHRFRAEGVAKAPVRRPAFTVATYALAVQPWPGAAGAPVRVRVVSVP